MQNNVIYGINGPVVTVANTRDFSMQEMVYVGQERLVGEVIGISDEHTIIQVYEVTTGLRPGDPVVSTGSSMSVTLGPGIISNIFDGIERPLPVFAQNGNSFIERGSSVDNLDPDRLWDVTVTVSIGDELTGGQIYAQCPETASILHRCLVPVGLSGKVTKVSPNGQYRIHDTVVILTDAQGVEHPLTLCQKWPIRQPRPVARRRSSDRPLITASG